MAYPLDTAIETAISNFELALVEDKTAIGTAEAVENFRKVVKFLGTLSGTGYNALAQKTDQQWKDEDLYNGPND